MDKLGRTLKELRENQGLSQSEVASYLGVSRQTYIKYENGEIDPPLKVVRLVRRLFKTSYEILLDGGQMKANESYSYDGNHAAETPVCYGSGQNIMVSSFEKKVNTLPLDMRKIVYDLVDSLTDVYVSKDNDAGPVYRTPGGLTGKFWMADDFDETPEGFEEYM